MNTFKVKFTKKKTFSNLLLIIFVHSTIFKWQLFLIYLVCLIKVFWSVCCPINLYIILISLKKIMKKKEEEKKIFFTFMYL